MIRRSINNAYDIELQLFDLQTALISQREIISTLTKTMLGTRGVYK